MFPWAQAIESSTPDKRVTWALIRRELGGLMYRVSSMKFLEPSEGEEAVTAKLRELNEELHVAFRRLAED